MQLAGRVLAGLFAVAVSFSGGGCIGSRTTACGSTVCPEGQICHRESDPPRCVLQVEIDACDGLADGARCSVGDRTEGHHCQNGVCLLGRCGDGVVDVDFEECDDGEQNSDLAPDACRTTCRRAQCGDGVTDSAEACDDGNLLAGDGCSADCLSDESCGNGVVDAAAGEQCDCGTDASGLPSGCAAVNGAADGSCTASCVSSYCGNGDWEVERGEECDDGNIDPGDGCGPTCLVEACGNGFLDPTEQCDAGDDNSDTLADQCRTNCRLPRCGDGVVDSGEACDDGNTSDGDGCSANCQDRCGDGVRTGTEVCDQVDFGAASCQGLGFYAGALTCEPQCGAFNIGGCSEYCGDGVINGNELCDGLDQQPGGCRAVGAAGGAVTCNAYCQPSFDRCLWSRWETTISGTTEWLRSVWGLDREHVWAVGLNGTMLYHDGIAWQPVAVPATGHLQDVWASAVDDVWVVGNDGVILRNQGAGWVRDGTGLTTERLRSVWGTGAGDVWIVGDGGTILHYDGTAWSTPSSGTTGSLFGVWASGPNDVWAISTNTILHNDGGGWDTVDPGSGSGSMFALWGSGPGDIWIVGSLGLLLHYHNGTWSTLPRVNLFSLRAVSGSGPLDVWAVGEFGTVLHYDGQSWRADQVGSAASLFGVWAAASGDLVWTVGDPGVALRGAGGGWGNPGTLPSLTSSWGLWAGGPQEVWVVGQDGSDGAIYGFDGATWTRDATPAGSVHAVWGSAWNDIWAVGVDGMVLHYDGSDWTPDAVGLTTEHLHAVTGSGPDNVWAVGDTGTALHFDGNAWTRLGGPSIGLVQLLAVWTAGPAWTWAVSSGRLYEFDGSGWTTTNPGINSIRGIWGSAPNDIWVAAQNIMLHYDGVGWAEISLPGFAAASWIWGSSSTDIWAVGSSILHYDGATWSEFSSPVAGTLKGIWGSAPDDVWALSGGGEVLHLGRGLPGPASGVCSASVPAHCEATYQGSTAGAPDRLAAYGCAGGTLDGGEVIYRLESPVAGTLTVTLTPADGDLDLVVLGADGQGACDPSGQCLGASQTAGTSTEQVVLPATRGAVYYLIVDGPSGAPRTFTLDVSCDKLL